MENMIERVISRTNAWANKVGYVKPAKKDAVNFTPEQNRVIEAMENANLGDYVVGFAQVISAITGIDVQYLAPKHSSGDDVEFEKGIMVVPLGNDNNHDYEIGVPCLCADPYSECFLTMDGTTGNELTTTKKLIRPATEGEIREFFDGFLGDSAD